MKFRTFIEAELNQQTMDKVGQYLAQLEQSGYSLLAHQTAQDTAKNIVGNRQSGFKSPHGSSLFVNSQQITQTVQTMNQAQSAGESDDFEKQRQLSGGIHKGSNAVLIMAIPKVAAQKGTQGLEDILADLAYGQQKISDLEVPNNYIVGAWMSDGTFAANGQFQPQGGVLG